MIKVLLVDDQKLIRQGICLLLEIEADIEVVGQASNGKEALEQVEHLNPEVVLMDVRMPEMDGVEATRRLAQSHPEVKVIILTTFEDDETVFEGLKAGARGYLLKDIGSEEMAEAVRRVARGEALIEPRLTSKVLAEFSRLASAGATQARTEADGFKVSLTERESEVLQALARGLSNREISETLIITEGTVKNHVSSLLDKLGVRDRTQAILKGQELGLIS